MSKIRLTVLSFLMLIFLTLGRGVDAQESISKPTDQFGCHEVQVQCIKAPCPVQIICVDPVVESIKCNWCGLGCVDTSKGDRMCAAIAPPSGKSCVNSGGKCTVVPTPDIPCGNNADCGPNSYCYQPPMPSCPPGAACKLMMPSRVCKSCIPRPSCLDGIKDANGKMTYCDPKPGMVYCPIDRTTPTPTKSCRSNSDCGTNAYCYQPPMPSCPPGAMCKQMMPAPYCRTCTPRPACMDANPACMPSMAPGSPPFCPKPPSTPCGFCGSNCMRLDPRMDCAAGGPTNGMKCVDVGGKCVVQKTTAQEGQMCGGIAGIMCATGLRCDYSTKVGPMDTGARNVMPDRSGICVRDSIKCEWCGTGCRAATPEGGVCPMIAPPGDKICTPENGACVIKPRNPNCIPRPACMDGIKDSNGKIIYCDPKPGVVYCPNNKSGDANGDGKADLVDFSIWKIEYIKKLIAKADFNKDGKVDLADFSIWKNAFLNITPSVIKKTTGAGGICGGIAGIMCDTGLRCNYTVNVGGADSSGVCIDENYPTPFEPPVKEGDFCGGPNGYNCNTSLGLECYRGSGPITTATVGVCRKVATSEGTRMCSSNEQCNTDEYCGYPVGAVIPEGQSPARACFKKPIPTIEGTRMCSSNEQCNTDEYCGYPVGAVIPEGQSPARACFKKPIPTIL